MYEESNNSSSWSFERPFHFESSGSLEEVVRSLAQLEKEGDFFSSSRNDISILPAGDSYSFRYRIRRRNKNSLYTTAVGEGQVWQAEDGPIIVEGQAQIEAWSLYGSMGLIIFMLFIFGSIARGFFGFLPLIMLAAGAFMIFRYYADRNLVIDRIAEAVANTHNVSELFRRDKDKRAFNAAKVKNTQLNVNESVRPDSVWNEAISEYEDEQDRNVR
jgi:hypothetical protein